METRRPGCIFICQKDVVMSNAIKCVDPFGFLALPFASINFGANICNNSAMSSVSGSDRLDVFGRQVGGLVSFSAGDYGRAPPGERCWLPERLNSARMVNNSFRWHEQQVLTLWCWWQLQAAHSRFLKSHSKNVQTCHVNPNCLPPVRARNPEL